MDVTVLLLFLGIPIHIDKDVPSDTEQLFVDYAHKYNKTYKSNLTEYLSRLETFIDTLERIKELNQNQTPGSEVYGLMKFSDMSQSEFQVRHLQPRLHHHVRQRLQRRDHNTHHGHHAHVHQRAVSDNLPISVDCDFYKVFLDLFNLSTFLILLDYIPPLSSYMKSTLSISHYAGHHQQNGDDSDLNIETIDNLFI